MVKDDLSVPLSAEDSGAPMWVVAAALVNDAGKVLVQQRAPGGQHGNLWEFPGGKIEAGESPEAALVRELFEELRVAIAVDDLHPVSFVSRPSENVSEGHRSVIILLFAIRRWEGTPEPLAASHIAWCDPHELATWSMPPLDYPLATALAKMLAVDAF
jgi:8-oxo-dGTP diphosphatase